MTGNGHVSQACLWSETRYVQCFVCLELFLLSKPCGSMWTLTTHDGSNISTHQKRLLTCSRPCAPRSAAMPGNWNTVFSTCCESRSPATGLLFGKRGVAGSHRFNLWPFRIKTDHRQTKWDMLALWVFSLSFQGGPPNGSPVGPFYVENFNFPAIKWGGPFPRPKKLIF